MDVNIIRRMIPAGLIGYGYWGPNLLRNLQLSGRFELQAGGEHERGRLALARLAAPAATCHEDALELMDRPDVAAVLIATPVATHYPLAGRAIGRGQAR